MLIRRSKGVDHTIFRFGGRFPRRAAPAHVGPHPSPEDSIRPPISPFSRYREYRSIAWRGWHDVRSAVMMRMRLINNRRPGGVGAGSDGRQAGHSVPRREVQAAKDRRHPAETSPARPTDTSSLPSRPALSSTCAGGFNNAFLLHLPMLGKPQGGFHHCRKRMYTYAAKTHVRDSYLPPGRVSDTTLRTWLCGGHSQ